MDAAVVKDWRGGIPGVAVVGTDATEDVAHVGLAAQMLAKGNHQVPLAPPGDDRHPDAVVGTAGIERGDFTHVDHIATVAQRIAARLHVAT